MSDLISALRRRFTKHGINCYFVPSTDEFLNEIPPQQYKRLKALTNFSGSYGSAFITQDKIILLTDGRYTIQANLELKGNFSVFTNTQDLGQELQNLQIGYDSMTISHSAHTQLSKVLTKLGSTLIPIEQNLVDEIIQHKTSNCKEAFELSTKYSGLKRELKIEKIAKLIDQRADLFLLTNPDSICWLLNIRGYDTENTPYLLSYLTLDKKGGVILFTEPYKAPKKIKGVKIEDIKYFKSYFKDLINERVIIQACAQKTPQWIFEYGGKNVLSVSDPCEILKAIKNNVEIEGIKKAHYEDGIALTKFLYWLKKNALSKKVDELQAEKKLLSFRRERDLFQYPSFDTISAFGPNGAIVHYRANAKSNLKIDDSNIYLLDSGGQYLNGTTDVTRTICIGEPTNEQMRLYTLVLRCHINLIAAKFPIGTFGEQLDSLARIYLWKNGVDYNHGTGHGVGHFLSVHEGPQRISKSSSKIELQENMILSIEPGFYKENCFGIRIENLVRVVKSEFIGFLKFEPLTLVPISTNLIDKSLLSTDEISWLKNYNNSVYRNLKKELSPEEQSWLLQETEI